MWWEYVVIAVLLIFGVYAFLALVGFKARLLTRKTSRTAESMYSNYADPKRKQHRYARQRGGESKSDEDA